MGRREGEEAAMVLLEKLWDDVVAGPQPDKGLGKLRKLSTKPLVIKGSSNFFFTRLINIS